MASNFFWQSFFYFRIQEWLDHREEVRRVLEATSDVQDSEKMMSEVNFLEGERRMIQLPQNQEKMIGRSRKSLISETIPAPRIPEPPQIKVEQSVSIPIPPLIQGATPVMVALTSKISAPKNESFLSHPVI